MNKKLTIGLVLDDGLDSTDGVQQYVLGLGQWLSEHGHDVHYLVGETNRRDIKNVHSLAKNIRVRFNKNRLSIPLFSSKKQLKAVLGKYDFDILHVQVPHSPLMGARIMKYAPQTTAIVGTFHILPSGWLSRLGNRVLGWWLYKSKKRFDEITSVSKPAQKFAKKYYGIDSDVISNFVDISKFKTPKTSRNNKQLKLIFLGRLVRRKGCLELMRALNYMQNNHLAKKTYKIDIIGGGPMKHKLKNYTKTHGLERKVKFHGYVAESKKARLLGSADIAIFPSTGGESFGIVLVEAMASGTLTIGGDNPGYASVLHSVPESLIQPTQTLEFAANLASLINNPEKRARLQASQQKLIHDYDINTIGKKMYGVYTRAKHDKLAVS